MDEELLSSDDAARALGIGPSRLRDLIASGRLPARKVGHTWVIFRSDLGRVAERRPGRPRGGGRSAATGGPGERAMASNVPATER